MAMPTVHMAAKCVVDGEDSEEIFEADIVTCAARVVVTRHSHLVPGEPSVVGCMPADIHYRYQTQIQPCSRD